jgi:hypothetical protein
MAVQNEDMDDAIPNRSAIKDLLNPLYGHQSGFAAMLAFNRLFELGCAHLHGSHLAWLYRAPFIDDCCCIGLDRGMPQDAAAKFEQILTEADALIRRRLEESGLEAMHVILAMTQDGIGRRAHQRWARASKVQEGGAGGRERSDRATPAR